MNAYEGRHWTKSQRIVLCRIASEKPGGKIQPPSAVLLSDTMEDEVANKNQGQRMKYYESVREHTLGIIQKAEEAIQQLKVFGNDFSDVFEKTSKRHTSLLNKIAKLVERDRKKPGRAAKVDVHKVKTVKEAKPLTDKPKPPASKKRSSASQPEGL